MIGSGEILGSLSRRAEEFKSAVTTRSSQQLVEGSGFFDAAWYLATYPDVGIAGSTPSQHYLRHGFREGRSPGPLFDNDWYLEQNPDVRQANLNPLVQYLRSGPEENRVGRSIEVAPPWGRTNLVVDIPRHFVPPRSVAVMVHAFYEDTFDHLCEALQAVTFPFTLMVSVPSESARVAAIGSITRHNLPARPDVRVLPNRGRNFGPLVASFGPDIARHDFLLHLHTKKSLFTGTEQQEWRDALVSALIGSRAIVQATMELFSQHDEVGLVFPTTTPTLPHWAHHWLRNRHLAPALFERLGVKEFPGEGYFEYPVGGMFWARVDAIRPLLESGLAFEDFPGEGGQTDGTLAHAIERCFVPLAASRRYEFVEFNRDSGAFQLGWGAKNLDQYRSLSAEGLRIAIKHADLVSFDIFDTVLTRLSTTPDAVIRAAGERVRRLHPGAHGFFDLRKGAELAARERKNWVDDVSLSEIYAEFPRSGAWDDGVIALAHATELACDAAVSIPRHDIVAAVRYARSTGARVIAISDTYFERAHIDHLLRRCGLEGAFDELYLSSAQGARKDRGDLWDLVVDREPTPVDRWLHVGDNEQSDLQSAGDRRIRTFHVMNPRTLLELRGLDLSTSSTETWGTDLLLGPVTASLGNSPFLAGRELRPLEIPTASELGYTVFGPVVMGFLAWIAQHPAMRDVDHVYFLSREGYLLRQVWEGIRAAGGGELAPSTYLLTSRRSSMASAQAVRFDADQILEGSGFEGTVGDMLVSRLGLSLPEDNRIHVNAPPVARGQGQRTQDPRRAARADRGPRRGGTAGRHRLSPERGTGQCRVGGGGRHRLLRHDP